MTQHDLESIEPHPPNDIAEIREKGLRIAHAAHDAQCPALEHAAGLLVDLMACGQQSSENVNSSNRGEDLWSDCQQYLSLLEMLLQSDSDATDDYEELAAELESRWGATLSALPEQERFDSTIRDAWSTEGELDWPADSEDPEDTAEDLQTLPRPDAALTDLLDHLDSPTSHPPVDDQLESVSETGNSTDRPSVDSATLDVDQINDVELIPAYVDDAQQCLAGMEVALMTLEQNPADVQPLRQFCRELHTLKGASGTVGLLRLSQYLHDVESDIEQTTKSQRRIEADVLLECVDNVRRQLERLAPGSAEAVVEAERDSARPPQSAVTPSPVHSSTASTPPTVAATSSASADATPESFVRLESSRLDRLMDLLAELVMLRNRRDSYVTSLQTLLHEVNSCATRLRLVDTTAILASDETLSAAASSPEHGEFTDRFRSRSVTAMTGEIAKDISELGRSLHQILDPLAQDNSTISHLIGSFRSELMELRRQPIGGLFRRLYRVARDAAKAEQRSVEVEFLGQGTRAERALQDRMYEPLMHMIRNAVSHGIESAEERQQRGKPETGKITLNAYSDATSLSLEVKDDGRGLDEQRLEQRGRELGLVPMGANLSREELWQLILQPGFSTRKEVSQISGRGVGMDVVASQVRALRGRIKIDSVTGQYTSVLLEIPLRSTIEHSMIVRSGDQLYALPMHSVYGTQTSQDTDPEQQVMSLNQIFGTSTSRSSSERIITLRRDQLAATHGDSEEQAKRKFGIAVDAVLGVEEVVVRSLPKLLGHHECFSGVTLSGAAETVLVLDVHRLCELADHLVETSRKENTEELPRRKRVPKTFDTTGKQGLNSGVSRLLVVDDSLSVRKSLCRKLNGEGYVTSEASDGQQALAMLRSGEFSGVISDIDMPRMNGIELLREMRRMESLREMPVVVVTGRRDPKVAKAVERLQARRVFIKPVTDNMVQSIVRALRFTAQTIGSAE